MESQGESESTEEEETQDSLYAQNSLLQQLVEGNKSHRIYGPLINSIKSDLVHVPDNFAASNSLLDKKEEEQGGQPRRDSVLEKTGQTGAKFIYGPLLGAVNPEEGKPKLEGGLLGEVNRREREKEALKKGIILELDPAKLQQIELERFSLLILVQENVSECMKEVKYIPLI